MKSLLAAGAAVAMLTLAFNAPLGPDTAAAPTATASRPLALSDFLATAEAQQTCPYKVDKCVQQGTAAECPNNIRYRVHVTITETDCTKHDDWGAWTCNQPSVSTSC